MTVDRVTLQDEHVPQFVVVWLASFVFYFIFILSLNNHLDPFYRDRFYLGPFLPGPFLPAPGWSRDRWCCNGQIPRSTLSILVWNIRLVLSTSNYWLVKFDKIEFAKLGVSVLSYWHHNVVCLSICLWGCALRLNDTSYSKSVWGSEQEVPSLKYDFTTFNLLQRHRGLKFPIPQRRKSYIKTYAEGIKSRLYTVVWYYKCIVSNSQCCNKYHVLSI